MNLARWFLVAVAGALATVGTSVADPDPVDGRRTPSSGVAPNGSYPIRPDARPWEAIGTIRAVLDGEERIWYVVSGEVGDRRQPGAFWMDLGDSRMAVLGGYDTEDFDFAGVEYQGMMAVSLGDYEGSLLSLAFPVPDGGEGSWTIPSGATVSYMSEAHTLDYSTAMMMVEGTVEATLVQLEGPCRFEGRFGGTLRPMEGEGAGMEIRDGTFEVEGCERFDPTGGP